MVSEEVDASVDPNGVEPHEPPHTSPRVLVVSTHEDARSEAVARLRETPADLRLTAESADSDARARLEGGGIDCLLCGFEDPGSCLDFARRAREVDPDLPVVVYTDAGSESLAGDFVSAGVSEYLLADETGWDELAARIHGVVEAALQDRETLDRMTDAFFALDEDWAFTYLNERGREVICEAMHGEATIDELVGTSIWEAIPEAVDTTFYERYHEAMETQESVAFEAFYAPLDTWFEVRTYPSESGLSVYFRDVTARKEYEARLETARRRFEAVFNDPSSYIVLMDVDGTVEQINDPLRSFVRDTRAGSERDGEGSERGTDREGDGETDGTDAVEADGDDDYDPVGRPFWDLPWWRDSDDLRDRVGEWIEQAAVGEFVRYEMELHPPEGEALTIDGVMRPVVDSDGEIVSLIAEGRDISDRKRLQTDLQRREAVLRSVYSTVSDKELDFTAKVDALLETCREELGTEYATLSRVEGEDYVLERVIDPDGNFEAGDVWPLSTTNCERAIATEQTLVLSDIAADAPELAARPGYTDLGISCYVGTPVTVEGDVHGTFCFYDRAVRDEPFSEWEVTLVELVGNWVSYELERERRETELTRQRNRLEDFASIVSHDLRNPLNVATGRLELAREDCDSAHLDEVEAALSRIGELIDDVLTLARLGQQVVDGESVDFGTAVTQAWGTAGGPEASMTVVGDLGVVTADDSRLRQLFENLFRNCVEHAGPDVHVRVGRLDAGTGFFVEDDGPGIDPEQREDAFDRGFSTRPDGTGFGLTIVAEVAEAHGWSVSLTESEAGGARFEFSGVAVDSGSQESVTHD